MSPSSTTSGTVRWKVGYPIVAIILRSLSKWYSTVTPHELKASHIPYRKRAGILGDHPALLPASQCPLVSGGKISDAWNYPCFVSMLDSHRVRKCKITSLRPQIEWSQQIMPLTWRFHVPCKASPCPCDLARCTEHLNVRMKNLNSWRQARIYHRGY